MRESGAPGKRVRQTTGLATVFASVAFVAIVVLAGFALLLGASGGARAQFYDPLGNFEPNPQLEGNVTFSSHATGWAPLEYQVSSGVEANLSASLDPRLANPLSINPTGIVAIGTLQGNKVATATTTAYWNSTTYFSKATTGIGGATVTGPTVSTSNGFPTVTATVNTSNAGASGESINANLLAGPTIPISLYPSANAQFDYITAIYGLSGPSCASSNNCWVEFGLNNGSASTYPNWNPNGTATSHGGSSATEVQSGGIGYVSISLAQASQATAGLNTTVGKGYAASFTPNFQVDLPKTSTAGTYTLTVYGFAFTTAPLTLGTTTWSKHVITRQVAFGNLNLTTLAPTFAYSSIAGGSYTAGIVQTAENLPAAAITITTSPVSINNATAGGLPYVEQATYSFTYSLPTAAALSYGAFNLQDRVNISGAQYASVSFGGTSYTAIYQALGPCGTTGACTGLQTYTVIQSTVGPTTSQAWVGIIDLTAGQWTAISTPPSIFSSSGLEYWWFIIIGAIAAVLGGSGWVVQQQRNLRTRGVADMTFSAARRRFRKDHKAEASGRHIALLLFAAVMIGAGAVGLWSFYDGADLVGTTSAFIGGFLLLGLLVVICFGAYEIMHRAKHRRTHG